MSFLDKFVDWAHQGLLQSDEAQEFLLGRGSSIEQWSKHKLGFTIGEFDLDPSQDPSHSPPICSDRKKKHLWCDSCRYKNWSSTWESDEDNSFRNPHVGRRIVNSIVFPLTSYSGTTVGIQVRSIREKSYDTFTVKKRPEGYFFGTALCIEKIWQTKEVFLVEGPNDQLIMERLVSPNVLALTTNSVGLFQIRFLRRFVDRINLCLDLDEAGRKGTRSFIELYGHEFHINDIKYGQFQPGMKDPGDLWKKFGDVIFSRRFQSILGGNHE